ncbi:Vgb family protein [Methanosalsum natronophilum]|uniref:Vgb family protein n=1 Tax=Methanosalsum natronophilum TaxID=768733 RepID=UPI002169AAE3|nr:hypothetical protein [Methanosalsum natronophilum]MCS3924117.1 streptogramin lyase [Methanosalsum natronophilum]
MKLKISMILVILLSLAMLLAMVSSAGAQEGDILEDNFGFVPNSWDASVSKVDLANFTEVARYYTAPRDGVDVRSWRTNRIAMDAEGNAWVLNTGTDAFRYDPPEGLQGQVIRIQGDTEGLANTHAYPNSVLDFGTDDAVQVFNVSGINDMPRAIAVDVDGYIWVGFYGSGELHKYNYTENGNLELLESFSPGDSTISFYEIKFAPNGELFISSRSSTPDVSGDFGIWRFDGEEFYHEQGFNSPYGLLISDEGIVYATSYNDVLRIRDTDGTWSQVSISEAQNLRGMSFDDSGKIWIASTDGASGGDRVFWFDPQDNSSDYITLDDGNTPVGVGKDAAGNMWAVCRTDDADNGFIEAINATEKTVIGSIELGPRPYAYGDFTRTTPLVAPNISIKKFTNGIDAMTPPGPWVLIGQPVKWTFNVTNTGDVNLTSVTVKDNKLGTIGEKDELSVGESVIFEKTGIAKPFQQNNTARVTGWYEEIEVNDSDPSHYFGYSGYNNGVPTAAGLLSVIFIGISVLMYMGRNKD